MSDVTLPTARLTAAAVPAAASAAPGTISDPPATVRQLALGSYLQGTVMSSDEPGQLLIRTELGSLPITTKAQLAAGTQVTVQLRSSGSQLHVVLMQVEGKAVAKAAAASVPPASEARPAPLSGQAGPSPAPLPADPGALRPVPGTVANPPPG